MQFQHTKPVLVALSIVFSPLIAQVLAPSSSAFVGTAAAATANALGDLSIFRSIAVDVATKIDKGDFAAAVRRIKDLEIAWDGAEAGIKPRAAAQWHVLDKAIDSALNAVRMDKLDAVQSRTALAEVIRIIDQSGNRS